MKTKALVKTVLCYAMALAMLVTTALPVSAAGLRGIYNLDSNTEGSGEGSGSGSSSKPIEVGEGKKIVGVVLDKSDVSMVAGDKETLTATILYEDGSVDKGKDTEHLWWTYRQTGDSTIDWPTSNNGKNGKATAEFTALHGGEAVVTVSVRVKTEDGTTVTFSDSAKISVLEYATRIYFDPIPEQYFKHTLNLNDYLRREPETSNDAIDFSLVSGVDSAGKEVKATKLASIKNGVVTFKSVEGVLTVRAVSEKGKVDETTIEIIEGNPIIKLDYADKKDKKKNLDVSGIAGLAEDDLVVVPTYKYPEKDPTEFIEWDSKKGGVASVVETWEGNKKQFGDATKAKVKAVGVGSTTITAKTTTGKKITFTVKSVATLTDLKIKEEGKKEGDTTIAYNGQTVQLEAVRTPKTNTDKVKWSIDKADQKYAKVNAKGVVTVAKTFPGDVETKEITVTASCGKGDNAKVATYKLTVNRLYISRVDIAPVNDMFVGDDNKQQLIVNVWDDNGTNLLDRDDPIDPYDVLSWKSSKAKVASVDGNGLVEAISKGTAKVTAFGYNNKGKQVSGLVSINVKSVVTQLQLNKTVVNLFENTNKDQKVSLSVKKLLPAGAQTGSYKWESSNPNFQITEKQQGKKAMTIVVKKGTAAGESATITVTADSGATASAVVTVCNKTTKVEFEKDRNVLEKKDLKQEIGVGVADGQSPLTVQAFARADGLPKNNETVEYSVNKKGIVTVIKNNDRTISVYGIKKGTVKITAKTPSGKKAVLTVVVK